MAKEDNRMRKDREDAKNRIEEIEIILSKAALKNKEMPDLEDEKRSLENTLAMFEVDDD